MGRLIILIMALVIGWPGFSRKIQRAQPPQMPLPDSNLAYEELACGIARPVPRFITFAGQRWMVKDGWYDPGPNRWSDSPQSVWVDASGRLHLKIRKAPDGSGGWLWYSAEVCAVNPTVYGTHRFFINAPGLNENVVLGLFLYKDYRYAELDVELAKWGNAADPTNAQYVAQPWTTPGNLRRFTSPPGDTTHIINWRPGYIRFRSIVGHYPEVPTPTALIDEWLYTGPNNPPESENPRLHLNLWLNGGSPPSDGQEAEVIITDVEVTLLASSANAVPKRQYFTSPVVELRWSSITWAQRYEVQADTRSTFNSPYLYQTQVDAGTLAVTPTLTNGAYYWRVRAQHANGTWGAWTALDTFVVDAP
ncbi:MAG: glycoside hydrolase family 16 protein [Chloroflexi bacterium]|nr:glycoside hydrolase family 16 protein [Chloroflexota bacterium]